MGLFAMRNDYGTARERKARRQKEAIERNAAYQSLTLEERLARQKPYNGKQYKKLLKEKGEKV